MIGLEDIIPDGYYEVTKDHLFKIAKWSMKFSAGEYYYYNSGMSTLKRWSGSSKMWEDLSLPISRFKKDFDLSVLAVNLDSINAVHDLLKVLKPIDDCTPESV